MIPTNIIKKICDIMREEEYEAEKEACGKENDEYYKWLDILEKYMEGDNKFKSIFFQYDMADGLYQAATNDYYFKQGFLYGARLILEICRYE